MSVLRPSLFALLMVALPASADDTATLRHLKEVLWPRAYATQDAALLDRILADEFQMIDAGGVWSDKAGELAWVRDNAPGYDSLTYTIRRLDVLENGTAIIAGEGVIRGHDAEGAWITRYQSSNVLVKRDGVWRAVASHVSGVKREPRPAPTARKRAEV